MKKVKLHRGDYVVIEDNECLFTKTFYGKIIRLGGSKYHPVMLRILKAKCKEPFFRLLKTDCFKIRGYYGQSFGFELKYHTRSKEEFFLKFLSELL